MSPAREVPLLAWRDDTAAAATRCVPEEVPIALTYNRTTYAVMMATPADLEDFATGFSLTERVVGRADEIHDIEIITVPDGIELRLWIDAERVVAVERRLRRIAGPTGCGLCGIDSLAEAARPPAPVAGDLRCSAADLLAAMRRMAPLQTLNHTTRAVHAAAFWRPGTAALVALREDVGRHNALDKLAGALARGGEAAGNGALLLTSRVSVELVQKAAALGAPLLAAVSAPTALALRTAEAAGITLAGIVRADGFELFTHPRRVAMQALHDAG
jgi:FdhD protein